MGLLRIAGRRRRFFLHNRLRRRRMVIYGCGLFFSSFFVLQTKLVSRFAWAFAVQRCRSARTVTVVSWDSRGKIVVKRKIKTGYPFFYKRALFTSSPFHSTFRGRKFRVLKKRGKKLAGVNFKWWESNADCEKEEEKKKSRSRIIQNRTRYRSIFFFFGEPILVRYKRFSLTNYNVESCAKRK